MSTNADLQNSPHSAVKLHSGSCISTPPFSALSKSFGEKFRDLATFLNLPHGRIRFGKLISWDYPDVNKTHDRLEMINALNLVP